VERVLLEHNCVAWMEWRYATGVEKKMKTHRILTFQQTCPTSSPVLPLNCSSSLLWCEERKTHVCCKMLRFLDDMFQMWMTSSSPLLKSN